MAISFMAKLVVWHEVAEVVIWQTHPEAPKVSQHAVMQVAKCLYFLCILKHRCNPVEVAFVRLISRFVH